MFLKRAREPYEPNMSAAMMTPPVNLTPSTDVPVTMGFLQETRNKGQHHRRTEDKQEVPQDMTENIHTDG